MAARAQRHDETEPRGVRDPRKCQVQAGGRLVFLLDGQPYWWTDRPLKFAGHVQHILDFYAKQGRSVELSDIKWKKLGGKAYWRIPAWPSGRAVSTTERSR